MVDVCIIGFGLSSIPLIRELERTGTSFQVISGEDDSVWDRLADKDQLDFNLVTSYHTSFYSFALAADYERDFYPTARQFYEMHKRWRAEYGDRVIRDYVAKVENLKDRSIITTRSGSTYEAKHLVVATGFERSMNRMLADFDYNVANKTFVFGSMGDSANMMIAKLVPNNNKIIIRMSGFTALDQELRLSEHPPLALDQFEFHNLRYVSPKLFSRTLMTPVYPELTAHPAVFFNQFPLVRRDFSWVSNDGALPNGLLTIKYWPIDHYQREFGDDLEKSIEQGYLLNDIAMWMHTGKVVVVPPDTPIDIENKSIRYAGVEKPFDRYIKGDTERPRLPAIVDAQGKTYEYSYRSTFMGVVPRELDNVYFLGYTRPFTGGQANIAEMQSLLIHKLATQDEFHRRIHANLDECIDAYNRYYYGDCPPRRVDHIVVYGQYTDDIARIIGIDHKPQDCESLEDLIFYYVFPNNAFKYRARGEYSVSGVDELIEKVKKNLDLSMFFGFLLKVNSMEFEKLGAWFDTAWRFMFNDMRFKEGCRPFLERYIETYRRVKNSPVEPQAPDADWKAIVREACKDRDLAVQAIEAPESYQMTEDVYVESLLVESLRGASLSELISDDASGGHRLDSPRRQTLRSMWNPPNHAVPYLNV